MRRFADRREAGRELGTMLQSFAGRPDVTVLALRRCAVPVAFEVAGLLDAPLNVFGGLRKLGLPDNEALASGRTVIVVDDGLATVWCMHAAVLALRAAKAERIIVASPAASSEARALLRDVADACVFAYVSDRLSSVREWYEDFAPPTDTQVLSLLSRAPRRPRAPRIVSIAPSGGGW
jgi:predicted phosphoribosyltransferase